MHVRDRNLGQLDPASITGSTPDGGGISPLHFFLLAVASGVTVWFITRALDGKRRR